MKLLDLGTRLYKEYNIYEDDIYWVKAVYDVDTRKNGGYQFLGDWINLRFQKGVKAPCPLIVCTTEDDEAIKKLSRIEETKKYHLIDLEKDGSLTYMVNVTGLGWAYQMVPLVLEYFSIIGDEKLVDVSISGEALNDLKWIVDHMPDESANYVNAVHFALQFTKEMWSKKVGIENKVQSEDTNP